MESVFWKRSLNIFNVRISLKILHKVKISSGMSAARKRSVIKDSKKTKNGSQVNPVKTPTKGRNGVTMNLTITGWRNMICFVSRNSRLA